MADPTYSTDTDAVGVLITTEFGGPPVATGLDGYKLKNVYPYLYNPTVYVPPLDQSEGALALQEQEWVGEIQYLDSVDEAFLDGGEIGADVVFENPLDTVADTTGFHERSAGENVVDYDLGTDPAVSGGIAYGVTEAPAEVVETPSEVPQEGTETPFVHPHLEVAPVPVAAPVAVTESVVVEAPVVEEAPVVAPVESQE